MSLKITHTFLTLPSPSYLPIASSPLYSTISLPMAQHKPVNLQVHHYCRHYIHEFNYFGSLVLKGRRGGAGEVEGVDFPYVSKIHYFFANGTTQGSKSTGTGTPNKLDWIEASLRIFQSTKHCGKLFCTVDINIITFITIWLCSFVTEQSGWIWRLDWVAFNKHHSYAAAAVGRPRHQDCYPSSFCHD